jgi:hypothetical protein
MQNNDYEAVLKALKLTDLRTASRELKAVELKTGDADLRVYLRLTIGLLDSPVIRDADLSRDAWSPQRSPSIRPLVDYCQRRIRSLHRAHAKKRE